SILRFLKEHRSIRDLVTQCSLTDQSLTLLQAAVGRLSIVLSCMQRGGADPFGALGALQLFQRIGGKARNDTGPQQCAVGIGMAV
ncbi:hypothetical protein ACC754_41020, partial [Rhizobium johnstonii]